MKRFLAFILGVMLLMSGCASGSESEGTQDANNQEVIEEVLEEDESVEAPETNLPIGDDIGDVVMYISTSGGTSEDGNTPTILISKDTLLTQMSVVTKDYDRTAFSFVYIDGMLYEKEQFGDSQNTISIEGDFLNEGEHIISVVQYDGNEENGEILTYKEAKYIVKFK